ncbi:hypothetical protein MCUN1_002978 [Malassezia cuniculi]|uniref:Uncharacterized protein n=1 Tax=Malassezia cuniculi TaxID=948313 RepID=A0AAF0EWN5_9BASI|nr:hypothetical protein MCUN1_002978 [Malassezia cuniculi]
MSQAAPKALPAALRRSHRALLGGLQSLAYELTVLHRIWYKGRAQFRYMKWWLPLQRIRRLGSIIATGSLQGTVPLARSMEAPDQSVMVASDERVVGTEVLWAIADMYAALWGEEPSSCASLDKYNGPQRPADKKLADAIVAACAELVNLLMQLEQACLTCSAAVLAHLRTPPAPMHAPTCMGIIATIARIVSLAKVLVSGSSEALDGVKITPEASLEGLSRMLRDTGSASTENTSSLRRADAAQDFTIAEDAPAALSATVASKKAKPGAVPDKVPKKRKPSVVPESSSISMAKRDAKVLSDTPKKSKKGHSQSKPLKRPIDTPRRESRDASNVLDGLFDALPDSVHPPKRRKNIDR